MRSLVTVYDIANQADRNMTIAAVPGVPEKDRTAEDDEFGWNWSVFADTAAWANAWEEAEGKTPIAEVVRTMDLSTDGKESMASGTLGQLADFSVMMYLGAKVGDPVMRTTWYGAKSGTFAIGRPVERYVRGMASRYKEAPATGTWVFRKGEPLPDRSRYPHRRPY